MNFSDIISRVAILVFPGILSNLIYGVLKNRQERKDLEDFLQILVFSIISYGIYGLLISIQHYFLQGSFNFDVSILAPITDNSLAINWRSVFHISIVGLLLGIASAYFYKYRLITQFGIFIHATRHYSNEDVWTDFFEAIEGEWILVRDYKQNLTYYGWIKYYSTSNKHRELALYDVSFHKGVIGKLDKTFYESDAIYLSRSEHEIGIELVSSREPNDKIIRNMNMKSNNDSETLNLTKSSDESDEFSAKGRKPSTPKPHLIVKNAEQTKDSEKKDKLKEGQDG